MVTNYRSLASCCQDFFTGALQVFTDVLFSIELMKFDTWMVYFCAVPGFLTDDFNA